MARNIVFESLTTDIIKSESIWQGYLSINDNKNINNDLVNAIINNDNINIYVVYEDNSESELSITNKEVDTESALKSFNYEFDEGYVRTDNITNVAFSVSSELTPIKFVFYIEAQDTPVKLKSGGLRSGSNSTDISKIKLSDTTYNIKDTTARADILTKQDTLVSGTNIKTINNTSLLGSGNITIEGDGGVFIATYDVTTIQEIAAAIEDGKQIIVYDNVNFPGMPKYSSGSVDFLEIEGIQFFIFSITLGLTSILYTLDSDSNEWVYSSTNFAYAAGDGITINGTTISADRNPDNTYTKTEVNTLLGNKQDTLISGTNIKTINNTSLLGSGNITIGGDANIIETVKVNNTALPVSNKAVNIDLSSYATETYVQNYVNSLDARGVEY